MATDLKKPNAKGIIHHIQRASRFRKFFSDVDKYVWTSLHISKWNGGKFNNEELQSLCDSLKFQMLTTAEEALWGRSNAVLWIASKDISKNMKIKLY